MWVCVNPGEINKIFLPIIVENLDEQTPDFHRFQVISRLSRLCQTEREISLRKKWSQKGALEELF